MMTVVLFDGINASMEYQIKTSNLTFCDKA